MSEKNPNRDELETQALELGYTQEQVESADSKKVLQEMIDAGPPGFKKEDEKGKEEGGEGGSEEEKEEGKELEFEEGEDVDVELLSMSFQRGKKKYVTGDEFVMPMGDELLSLVEDGVLKIL